MAIYFVGFITFCKKSLDYSNAGFSLNFGEAYFSLDICKGSIFLHIRENVHKVKDGTDRFM